MRTEKFVRERAAQRALLGKYRNKYTDAVAFAIRSTANTNVFYFNGKLLAMKEDAPPYALHPRTLETVRVEDFDGQLPSVTFTAHPKRDPRTGELVCFGYEARGDGTPDVCYFTFDPAGTMTQEVWLVCPVVAMIHDFAVTDNWVRLAVVVVPRAGVVMLNVLTDYIPRYPADVRSRAHEGRGRTLAMGSPYPLLSRCFAQARGKGI